MDTLNNVIEKWVRDCVAESMKQLLDLHGRDANRIAALERRLFELEGGDAPVLEHIQQLTSDLESRVCDLDSEVEGLDSRVDSVEYSVSDLESTVEDFDQGIDTDALHRQVVDIIGGLEFGLKSTGE